MLMPTPMLFFCPRRSLSVASAFFIAVTLNACGNLPHKFIRQAEPGVTLTALKAHPDAYKGKVVILGGAIVEKREENGKIWLLIKNRPLDADYVPHVPTSSVGPEGGHYWVALNPRGLPKSYRTWARLTVVGRVEDQRTAGVGPAAADTVLTGLYLRGWDSGWGGYGPRNDTWEDNQSPNAILSEPRPVMKKE